MNEPMPVLFCLIWNIYIHINFVCVGFCVCFFFFTFLGCSLISKFCAISVCLASAMCVRVANILPFLMRLLCLLHSCVSLKFWVTVCCVLHTFFLTFLPVLVVAFAHTFFLFCCCVACAARVHALFVVSLFLFVLRLWLDMMVILLCVLCVCVHILCHCTCVCRTHIFWVLALLPRVCDCFVCVPMPLLAQCMCVSTFFLPMQSPATFGFVICSTNLIFYVLNPNP